MGGKLVETVFPSIVKTLTQPQLNSRHGKGMVKARSKQGHGKVKAKSKQG